MTMRWILTVGLMLIATGANATSGNKLLNHCKTGEGAGISSAIPFGTCLGFAAAVMEAMIANSRDKRLKPKAMADTTFRQGYMSSWEACFPAKAEPGDARNAAKGFLTAHPDKLDGDAVDLVAEAFAGAFPCPK